jgi:metal-dependent amidase/aminoacylase/carboxypeptidase family protein
MAPRGQAREAQLRGTALLVFQPAEEGGAGAQSMLASSDALRSAQAVFGLHVAPWLPLGTVSSRPGTIMAASTTFVATIRGVGGHAAFPHQARPFPLHRP